MAKTPTDLAKYARRGWRMAVGVIDTRNRSKGADRAYDASFVQFYINKMFINKLTIEIRGGKGKTARKRVRNEEKFAEGEEP